MANKWWKKWKQWETLISWAPKSLQMVTAAMKLRCLLPGRKTMTNLDSILKKQRHRFADKGPYSQSCGFPSSRVWMWELDHKEGWTPKNWCFQTVMLEKALESPLDCKEIKSVNPKENQLWIFIGRSDAEAEAPILWLPDAKSHFSGKDPDAGKDEGHEEKRATEDKMVGWHHQLNGHEFEQTLGNSEGQESLVCWSSWGRKDLDMTQQLDNNGEGNYQQNEKATYWKREDTCQQPHDKEFTVRGLHQKYAKNSYKLNSKKTNSPIKNGPRTWIDIFSKHH